MSHWDCHAADFGISYIVVSHPDSLIVNLCSPAGDKNSASHHEKRDIMPDSTFVLFLTKLLPVFVYPLGMTIVLTAIGAFCAACRRQTTALVCIGVSLTWLWVASMPVFAEWAIATLEKQYPAQALELTPTADVAIVLGGAVNQPVPPRVDTDLTASSDRVLHAMRLYRAGKVKQVIISGGNLPWHPSVKPEAELIRTLLVDWGVPAEHIEVAGESRNTYENALEVKAFGEHSPFGSALLVTSAAHMPRALAVFQKAGLPVIASTTDVEAVNGAPSTMLRWLPEAAALAMTTAAAREWIGYWAYRMRGYV